MNVMEMYVKFGNRAGFFVRRQSWARGTYVRVKQVQGKTSGTLDGRARNYAVKDDVGMRLCRCFGDVYRGGKLVEKNVEVMHPETDVYEMFILQKKGSR